MRATAVATIMLAISFVLLLFINLLRLERQEAGAWLRLSLRSLQAPARFRDASSESLATRAILMASRWYSCSCSC
jgi:hypothetical protein